MIGLELRTACRCVKKTPKLKELYRPMVAGGIQTISACFTVVPIDT